MAPGASVSVERYLEPLVSEWEDLADRCASIPFTRPGWIAAWSRAFGGGKLELLCLRKGGDLAGVIALRRRGRGLDSPTNYHTPLFGLLAQDEGARRDLARGVFRQHPRHLSVGFLGAERPDAGALRDAARAHGYRVIARTTYHSPYVSVDRDWPAYQRGLSRNLLGDLRRSRRRLEEQGEVSIEFTDGSEHLGQLLQDVFAVDARSWQAEARTAIVSHRHIRRFYEEVCRWAVTAGLLRAALLRVDGRPVAMQLALEEAGVQFAIKSSYDKTYVRFSPGKLLLHSIIERAFTGGLTSVELGGADEGYKRRWASDTHERSVLRAYAGSPIGWLEWTTDVHGRPLARRAGLARVRRTLQRLR